MKNRISLILCLSLLLLGVGTRAQNQQQRLENHVYFLAADSLNGRKAGSPDARRAMRYIENEYRAMGLRPLWGDDMRQYFIQEIDNVLSPQMTTINSESVSSYEQRGDIVYCNLVAVIPGSDPVLKDEYVVVGAHYDHLGLRNGKVYNGADDNASGSAAVIEMARQLMARRSQLARSVIICAFDAEEIGLWGSTALASQMSSCGLLSHVTMMMSIDMVGWLKGGKLDFSGTATLKDCSAMIEEAAQRSGIKVSKNRYETSPFGATDTEPFAKRDIPTLAVTTGLGSPYHKPEDDADLIDYPGMSKVTDCLVALVSTMASRETAMAATGKISPKHKNKLPVLEAGIVLGIGTNRLNFCNTAFITKPGVDAQVGLTGQLNFSKHLGLQVDALFDRSTSKYPPQEDLLAGSLSYGQSSLLVPAQLKLILGNRTANFQVGLGGFYSYLLRSDLTDHEQGVTERVRILPTDQYGLTWSLSVRLMEKISMGCSFYYAFNGYNDKLAIDTKRRSSLFNVSYLF